MVLKKDEKNSATNSACLQYVKKVEKCNAIADAATSESEVRSAFLDLERSTFMNYALQMNVMDIEDDEYGEYYGDDRERHQILNGDPLSDYPKEFDESLIFESGGGGRLPPRPANF